MIKLIVSDLDGVLLPHGMPCLSDGVKRWIARFRDSGVYVAVSTGRTYEETVPLLAEPISALICCDGAYYEQNGKAVYERPIGKADLERFFRRDPHADSCLFHGAHTNYGFGTLPAEADAFAPIPVSQCADITEKIFKVTAFGTALPLPAQSGLRMHWDGGAHDMAQYVNRFAHKGAALSDLQNRLGITPFETACLGDGENDIPMMRNAKFSYCVGSRSAALAKVCTHHISCAEEAFALLWKQIAPRV